jgi:Xaa-Pro aminopeptidase
MPHGLGHGIGLDVHESPSTGWREKNKDVLEVGMYVTLEPGLYHPDDGGVRLEDDIYISETGPVKMTRSRIVYL